MRIAYLVNEYPRTNISFVRRELVAVEALGHEVHRYSLRPLEQELVSEADQAEAARTRFVLSTGVLGFALAVAAAALGRPRAFLRAAAQAWRLWRSGGGPIRHVAYLAEACVILRWTRRARIEHVHAHFGTNSAAVALLLRLLGGPRYSFTVHMLEFDEPRALRLEDKVHHAAFTAVVSSYGRAQLFRWARFEDWPKVQIIRCGVDQALLGVPATPVPAAPRFVCVARLSEQKGHVLLLEAVAQLAREERAFEVVLAGDGPLRAEIERRIRAAGLERHVKVGGWMSEAQVRDEILASRALVLPSFAEGLPVALMEAMALGRPVISTAIAGVPELVEPGKSGWLVPAGAVEALAEAMRAALDASPARLGEMGRVGAEKVRELHDVTQEAQRIAALFEAAGRAEASPAGGAWNLAS